MNLPSLVNGHMLTFFIRQLAVALSLLDRLRVTVSLRSRSLTGPASARRPWPLCKSRDTALATSPSRCMYYCNTCCCVAPSSGYALSFPTPAVFVLLVVGFLSSDTRSEDRPARWGYHIRVGNSIKTTRSRLIRNGVAPYPYSDFGTAHSSRTWLQSAVSYQCLALILCPFPARRSASFSARLHFGRPEY